MNYLKAVKNYTPAQQRAYLKYREKNKEKYLEYCKAYYQENKEYYKKYARKYYKSIKPENTRTYRKHK
jgi:hypothetical protein